LRFIACSKPKWLARSNLGCKKVMKRVGACLFANLHADVSKWAGRHCGSLLSSKCAKKKAKLVNRAWREQGRRCGSRIP
jgi:hypothetical protein